MGFPEMSHVQQRETVSRTHARWIGSGTYRVSEITRVCRPIAPSLGRDRAGSREFRRTGVVAQLAVQEQAVFKHDFLRIASLGQRSITYTVANKWSLRHGRRRESAGGE